MFNNLAHKPTATEQDWHRADVIAALKKSGWTLRKLALANGYEPSLHKVFEKPWPNVERLIAIKIGLPPWKIWPSRYNPDDTPKSGRITNRITNPTRRRNV